MVDRGQAGPTGPDYGAEFRQPEFAQRYLSLYAPDTDTVDNWIWQLQRPYLLATVRQLAGRGLGELRLLDYACGGGGVLGEVAPPFGSAEGWDAGDVMRGGAARPAPPARTRLVDLSRSTPPADA